MKKLFQKELAIFTSFKSIRLHDLNLGGALLALIITVVNLLTNNIKWTPIIGGIFNTTLILILLIIIIVKLKNEINKRDLQAFICIQTSLLLLNILLESFFPLSIHFLKVFISLYVIFNIFVFILYSVSEPVQEEEITA
ncbi:hypothetical protein KHQ81_07390 [Mycoplasmatota bacterium]|nr:hypothetical protein KHQ81_07390 [Mycoplasmatota bacterium]